MSTVISQACAAIVSALSAVPAVAPQVARVKLRPWASEVASAVAVRPVQARRSEADLGIPAYAAWDVTVGVECYARATSQPDVAVDPLIAAVHERLLTDPTLGGAVRDIRPERIDFDFDTDGDQTVAAVLLFTVRMTCGVTFS